MEDLYSSALIQIIIDFSVVICLSLTLIFYILFVVPGNLVDWQIKLYLFFRILKISNLQESSIQPNSIDVHIGRHFAKQREDGSFDEFEADHIILAPGDFILGTTKEFFEFPSSLHGFLQGKSSWARLGLYVESAGLFDSGFDGEAVVELTNQGRAPLKLEAGKPIAQMILMRNLPVRHPYGKKKGSISNYQGQTGAKRSALEDRITTQ